MNDVFISYSRKNNDFAHRLTDKLSQSGKDAWVDWEDIPLTSPNWWGEIKAGIEAADSFIYILSPDSMASIVCNMELDYALQLHKRIIPLVLKEVESNKSFASIADFVPDAAMQERLGGKNPLVIAQNNWQQLSHINWLFFRETDDFDTTFTRLANTIETNLSYVKSHTRYLTRSQEWLRLNREADLLLFGEEILRAKLWLEQGEQFAAMQENTPKSAFVNPLPQALQREYIQASQLAEAQRLEAAREQQARELKLAQESSLRLRILVIGLSIGLIISILALLTGYIFYQRAEEQITQNYMNRGNVYLENGEYAPAVADFSEALKRKSSLIEGQYRLAQAQEGQRNYPAAMQAYAAVRDCCLADFPSAASDYERVWELRTFYSTLALTTSFEGSNYATYSDFGNVTYGITGFTLESGNLYTLVNDYVNSSNQEAAHILYSYLPALQDRQETLGDDPQFEEALVAAAEDPLMQSLQDNRVFENQWADIRANVFATYGIQTPLGQAMLFDILINHGPSNQMLNQALEEMGGDSSQSLQAQGLSEQDVLTRVAQIRLASLERTAERTGFVGLVRRGQFWVDLVQAADWNLQGDENGNLNILDKTVQIQNPTFDTPND